MLPASDSTSPLPKNLATTPKHILVVDDDELGCRAVCRLLERQGYQCREAHSATEALQIMESASFGLILADINMEGNTRLEFIQNLRNREAPVPIILITGHPSIETAAAATALDAAAYLLKPVNTDHLLQLVRKEFDRQAIFRALQEHRRKQEEALRLKQGLEAAFMHSNGCGASMALQSYITMTFEQMVDSLLDLKTMMETVVAMDAQAPQSERLKTARPLVLINAIQEAIQVLDHTRNSFKSKELAGLRQKLETLLNTSSASKTGTSSSFKPGTPSASPYASVPPLSATPFKT